MFFSSCRGMIRVGIKRASLWCSGMTGDQRTTSWDDVEGQINKIYVGSNNFSLMIYHGHGRTSDLNVWRGRTHFSSAGLGSPVIYLGLADPNILSHDVR